MVEINSQRTEDSGPRVCVLASGDTAAQVHLPLSRKGQAPGSMSPHLRPGKSLACPHREGDTWTHGALEAAEPRAASPQQLRAGWRPLGQDPLGRLLGGHGSPGPAQDQRRHRRASRALPWTLLGEWASLGVGQCPQGSPARWHRGPWPEGREWPPAISKDAFGYHVLCQNLPI